MYNPNEANWVGFANAMRASRTDVTVRLVFCDWLDERYGLGNPLSQFVRESMAYAQEDPTNALGSNGWDRQDRPDTRRGQTQARIKSLLRHTWLSWRCCKHLDPHVIAQWRWHMGFPERVVCPWDHWLRHYPTITAVGPVGEVFLCVAPEFGTISYPETGMIGVHIPDLWVNKRDHQILIGEEGFYTQPYQTRIALCEYILKDVWPDGKSVVSIQIDEGLNALRLPDEPVIGPLGGTLFP